MDSDGAKRDYGISRIDHRNTHCWWVRLDYHEHHPTISKPFADMRYGGKEAALDAARHFAAAHDPRQEQWRDAYRSDRRLYRVSNYGRVTSHNSYSGRKTYLSPYWSKKARGRRALLYVPLGQNNIKKLARVVADAFLPVPTTPSRLIHLDGDVGNCRADNLQWGNVLSREAVRQVFLEARHIKKETDITDGVMQYVVQGDRDALSQAWGAAMGYLPSFIRSHLWRVTGHSTPPELVEEIVQEALVRAQRAIDAGKLRTPENIEGWLVRIAQNTAVTYGKANTTPAWRSISLDINGDMEQWSDQPGKVKGWGIGRHDEYDDAYDDAGR